MILYQNELLKLDLKPALRLLEVAWPSFEGYTTDDAKLIFTRALNAILDYDVQYLLIDGKSSHIVFELSELNELITYFISELPKTSVKKIARLVSDDQNRELLVNHVAAGQPDLPEYQNFTDKDAALAWLIPGAAATNEQAKTN